MLKALIVYASHEGQTAKIAHEIAGALRFVGHQVEVLCCQDAPQIINPHELDLVVAGAPIHTGKHDKALLAWLRANRTELKETTNGFFSVSLAAASHNSEENKQAQQLARQAVDEAGCELDAIICFAGALSYSQYGFVKKLLMHKISENEGGDTDTSHDYEYTDWSSVCDFTRWMAEMAQSKRIELSVA